MRLNECMILPSVGALARARYLPPSQPGPQAGPQDRRAGPASEKENKHIIPLQPRSEMRYAK